MPVPLDQMETYSGMSLDTEDWETMRKAKKGAQVVIRNLHRAIHKIEETVDRQGLRLVVFSFSQVKLRSFSLKGIQFGSDLTLARIGKLKSVLNHFGAKRENKLSLRRSFLRWMVRSNPFFVKECVDRLALTTTLKKEVAVWRMKKMVEVALTAKEKKFKEFSRIFCHVLNHAQQREALSRKNFFLFALSVIKEKHIRQEWASKTKKMVCLVNHILGDKTETLIRNSNKFNPSKTLSTKLVAAYDSKINYFLNHMQFGNKKKNFAKGYKFFYCISNLYARKAEKIFKDQLSAGSSRKLGTILYDKMEKGIREKLNELQTFSKEKQYKIDHRNESFIKLERLINVHDKHCFISGMKSKIRNMNMNQEVFQNCLKVLRRSNKAVISTSLQRLKNNSYEVIKTNKIRILFWLEKSQRQKIRMALKTLTGKKEKQKRGLKESTIKRMILRIKNNFEFKLRFALERLSTLAGMEVQYEEWESSASHKRYLFNKMHTSMLNLKSIAMERLFRNYEYRKTVMENCIGLLISKTNKKLSWVYFTLLIETLNMEKQKQPGQVRILMVTDRMIKERQREVFNCLRNRKQALEAFSFKLENLFNKNERKQIYSGFNGIQRRAGQYETDVLTKEKRGGVIRRTLGRMMRDWDQQQHRAMRRLRNTNQVLKNSEKVLLKGLRNGQKGKMKKCVDKLRTENLMEKLYEDDLDLAGKLNRGGDMINGILQKIMRQHWKVLDRPRKMIGSSRKIGMMLENKMKGEALSQSIRRLRDNREKMVFGEITQESMHMKGNLMTIQQKVLPKYQDQAFKKNFSRLEQMLCKDKRQGFREIKKRAANKCKATKMLMASMASRMKNRKAAAYTDLNTNMYIVEEQDKLDGMICRNSSEIEKKLRIMSEKVGMEAIKKEADRQNKIKSVLQKCFAKHWKVDRAFEALRMNETIRNFLTKKQSRDVMKNHLAERIQKLFEKKLLSNERTMFRTLKRQNFKEKIFKKLFEGVARKLKKDCLENLRKFNLQGRLEGDISDLKEKIKGFFIKKMVSSFQNKTKLGFFGLRLNNQSESTRQISERFVREIAIKNREKTFNDLKYLSMKVKEDTLMKKNNKGGLMFLTDLVERKKKLGFERLKQFKKDKTQAERVLLRIMKTISAQLKRDTLTMLLNINRENVWKELIKNHKLQTLVNIVELKLLKRYSLMTQIKSYAYERKIAMDLIVKHDQIIRENMKRGLDRLRMMAKGSGKGMNKRDLKDQMTQMFMKKMEFMENGNKASVFFYLRTYKNLVNRKMWNLMMNLKKAAQAQKHHALRNLRDFNIDQTKFENDRMFLPKLLKNKIQLQKQNALTKFLNLKLDGEKEDQRKNQAIRNIVNRLSNQRQVAFQKLQRNSDYELNQEVDRNNRIAYILNHLENIQKHHKVRAFEKIYTSSEINREIDSNSSVKSRGSVDRKHRFSKKIKGGRGKQTGNNREDFSMKIILRNTLKKLNEKYGKGLKKAFYKLTCSNKRDLIDKMNNGVELVLNKKTYLTNGRRTGNPSTTLTQYVIDKHGNQLPIIVIGSPLNIPENTSFYIDKDGNKVTLPNQNDLSKSGPIQVYVDENGDNILINANTSNKAPGNQKIVIDNSGNTVRISTVTNPAKPSGKTRYYMDEHGNRISVHDENETVSDRKSIFIDNLGNVVPVDTVNTIEGQGGQLRFYIDENGNRIPVQSVSDSGSERQGQISFIIDENGNEIPITTANFSNPMSGSNINFYIDENGEKVLVSNLINPENQNNEFRFFIDTKDNQQPIENLEGFLKDNKVAFLVDKNGNRIPVEKEPVKPRTSVQYMQNKDGNIIPVTTIQNPIGRQSIIMFGEDEYGNKIPMNKVTNLNKRISTIVYGIDEHGNTVPINTITNPNARTSTIIYGADEQGNKILMNSVTDPNKKKSQIVYTVDENGNTIPMTFITSPNTGGSQIVFGVDKHGNNIPLSNVNNFNGGQSGIIYGVDQHSNKTPLSTKMKKSSISGRNSIYVDKEGNQKPISTLLNPANQNDDIKFFIDTNGNKQSIENLNEFVDENMVVSLVDKNGTVVPIQNPIPPTQGVELGYNSNGMIVIGSPTNFLFSNSSKDFPENVVSSKKAIINQTSSKIEDEPIPLGSGHVLLNGEVYKVTDINDPNTSSNLFLKNIDIGGDPDKEQYISIDENGNEVTKIRKRNKNNNLDDNEGEINFDLTDQKNQIGGSNVIMKNGIIYKKADDFEMDNGLLVNGGNVFEKVDDQHVDDLINNFNSIRGNSHIGEDSGHRALPDSEVKPEIIGNSETDNEKKLPNPPLLKKIRGKIFMELTNEKLNEDLTKFIEDECQPGEIHKVMIDGEEVSITTDEQGRIYRIGDDVGLPNGYYLKHGELKKKVENADLGNGMKIMNGKLISESQIVNKQRVSQNRRIVNKKLGDDEQNYMSRTSQIIDEMTGFDEDSLNNLENSNRDLKTKTKMVQEEAKRLKIISKNISGHNEKLEKDKKNLLLAQKVFGTNIENLTDDLNWINNEKQKEENHLKKMENETDQLENKLDRVRGKLKKLKKDKGELEQELENIDNKKEELKEKKDKVENNIEISQNFRDDLAKDLKKTEDDQTQFKAEKEGLKQKKDEIENEQDALEKERKLLNKEGKQVDMKTSELEKSEKKIEGEKKVNERKQREEQREMEDMKETLKKKNTQTRELNQDLENKYKDIKKMNEDYQMKSQEINGIVDENTDLLERREDLKDQKEDLEGEIYELKKDLRDLGDPDKKNKEFEDNVENTTNKLGNARNGLRTIINEISLVDEEIKDQQKKEQELDVQVKDIKHLANSKLTQSNLLFDEADQLDQEAERKRRDGEQEGAKEAEDKAELKRDERRKLIKEAEDLEEEIHRSNKEKSDAQKELEKMFDLKNTIMERRKKFTNLVDEKEKELDDIEKEYENWKINYNEKVDQLNEKVEDIETINGELTETKKALQKNEIRMKKLEGERDILIKDIEKIKLDIDQDLKKVEDLRREAKRIQNGIEEGEAKLEELEDEQKNIKDKKGQLEREKVRIEGVKEGLKNKEEDLNRREALMEGERSEVEKRMRRVEGEVEEARKQRSKMSLQIGELKKDIERKQNQLDLIDNKEIVLEKKKERLAEKDNEIENRLKNEGDKAITLEITLEKKEDQINNRKKKVEELDEDARKKEEKIFENHLKKKNVQKNLNLNENNLQNNFDIISKNKEKEAKLRGDIKDNESQITENDNLLNKVDKIRASLLFQNKYFKDGETQTVISGSERDFGIRERFLRLQNLTEEQWRTLEDPDQMRKIGVLKRIDQSTADKIENRGGISERDLDNLDHMYNKKTRDVSSETQITTGMGLAEEKVIRSHVDQIDQLKNKNSRLNQLIDLKQSEKDVAMNSLRNFIKDKLSQLIVLRFNAAKYKALQILKGNKLMTRQKEIRRKLFLTSIKSKIYNKTVKKTVKRDIGTKREKGLMILAKLSEKHKSGHYHYFKLMLHLRLMRLSLNALFKWKLDNLNLQNSGEYQDMIFKKKMLDTLHKITETKKNEAFRKIEMKYREAKLVAVIKKLSTVIGRAGNKYFMVKQKALSKWFRNRNINGWHDRILRRMVDKSTENQETALMKMFLFRRNKGGKGLMRGAFGVTQKLKNKAMKLQKIFRKVSAMPLCRAFQKITIAGVTQHFQKPRIIRVNNRENADYDSKPSQITISYNELDLNENYNRNTSIGDQSINSRVENSQQGFNEKLMASHSLSFLHSNTLNNVKLENITEQNKQIAEKLDKVDIFFVAKNGAFKLMVKTLTSTINREKKGYFVTLRESVFNGMQKEMTKRFRSRSRSKDPNKMNSLKMFIQENEKVRGELRKKTIEMREMEEVLKKKIETITSFKKHFMRKHFGGIEAIFDKYREMEMLRSFCMIKH